MHASADQSEDIHTELPAKKDGFFLPIISDTAAELLARVALATQVTMERAREHGEACPLLRPILLNWAPWDFGDVALWPKSPPRKLVRTPSKLSRRKDVASGLGGECIDKFRHRDQCASTTWPTINFLRSLYEAVWNIF